MIRESRRVIGHAPCFCRSAHRAKRSVDRRPGHRQRHVGAAREWRSVRAILTGTKVVAKVAASAGHSGHSQQDNYLGLGKL